MLEVGGEMCWAILGDNRLEGVHQNGDGVIMVVNDDDGSSNDDDGGDN